MKTSICLLSLAILCSMIALLAQVLPPNETGVSLGQWYTIVQDDMDAAKKFWTLLGPTPINVDGTEVMKFAGVLVFLTPGSPSSGSEGTVVYHVGFGVPDVRKTLAKLKAGGINVREPGPT